MVEIIYTEHLKARLKARKIPLQYPREIYENSEERFVDSISGLNIATKELYYNKKLRTMMIAYKEEGDKVKIITIHPITKEKMINRMLSGRWKRHE